MATIIRTIKANKEGLKTYAIIAMAAYIIGTFIIVHPITGLGKLFIIALAIGLGLVGEEAEMHTLSAMLLGFMLA